MTGSETNQGKPLIGILLRPEDVVRTFGCTKWFVHRLAQNGELPCIRIERTVRFDPRDVAEFIDGHRQEKGR